MLAQLMLLMLLLLLLLLLMLLLDGALAVSRFRSRLIFWNVQPLCTARSEWGKTVVYTNIS
jgi:hypothetical protein